MLDYFRIAISEICFVISANNKAKEAESKARNLEAKLGDKSTKEQRVIF